MTKNNFEKTKDTKKELLPEEKEKRKNLLLIRLRVLKDVGNDLYQPPHAYYFEMATLERIIEKLDIKRHELKQEKNHEKQIELISEWRVILDDIPGKKREILELIGDFEEELRRLENKDDQAQSPKN